MAKAVLSRISAQLSSIIHRVRDLVSPEVHRSKNDTSPMARGRMPSGGADVREDTTFSHDIVFLSHTNIPVKVGLYLD